MIAAWMLYSVVITACAAVAAWALEPVARARGLASRVVWMAAIVASLGTAVAMAVRPREVPASIAIDAPVSVAGETLATPVEAAFAPSLDAVIVAAWLVASLVMLVLVGGAVQHLRRVRARAPRAHVGGETVALAPDIGPGTTWFGQPRIVLPQWAASLSDEATTLLVRHEREHLAAHDPHLLAITLGALTVAPWNLPLWFLARRLRTAIEIDCDARVLAAGCDLRRYGELLLDVAARRPQRAPSLLLPFAAFASSTTSLERRIRAMTERRLPLSVRRALVSGSVAAAAFVAACEARRPEPLAPVTTYNSQAKVADASPTLTAAQEDSARSATSTELRAKVVDTILAGDPADPILVVYSSTGTGIYSARIKRFGDNGIGDVPINPSAIATMTVESRRALLPANASGGVIRIVLKPGAERAADTWTRKEAMRANEGAPADVATGKPRVPMDSMLVVVLDANGTELLRARGETALARVDQALIASVDVLKNSDLLPADGKQGMVKIVLKPGAALKP